MQAGDGNDTRDSGPNQVREEKDARYDTTCRKYHKDTENMCESIISKLDRSMCTMRELVTWLRCRFLALCGEAHRVGGVSLRTEDRQ